jgi:hypothetical protein
MMLDVLSLALDVREAVLNSWHSRIEGHLFAYLLLNAPSIAEYADSFISNVSARNIPKRRAFGNRCLYGPRPHDFHTLWLRVTAIEPSWRFTYLRSIGSPVILWSVSHWAIRPHLQWSNDRTIKGINQQTLTRQVQAKKKRITGSKSVI